MFELLELEKKNPIVEKTFKFSLDIIAFNEKLKEIKQWSLADQLFRSGTSIGANVWEAQDAESQKDFLHKMKIAAKEGRETRYWLLLCKYSDCLPDTDALLNGNTEIRKILNSIIGTIKSNLK